MAKYPQVKCCVNTKAPRKRAGISTPVTAGRLRSTFSIIYDSAAIGRGGGGCAAEVPEQTGKNRQQRSTIPCRALQPLYANLAHKSGDFPTPKALGGGEILSLPMYPELTKKKIGRVGGVRRGNSRSPDRSRFSDYLPR